MLIDRFNRIHDYLRISLTDNCNFRCKYCMPLENMHFLPQTQLMQVHEIEQIASVFVGLGVKKIRLTGGEPLVRKEAKEIIEKLAKLPVELTLTSNGFLIDKFIPTLQNANIRSINISLDSLQPQKFLHITQRNHFQKVWNNILLLIQEGFHVKINVVATKGENDDEIIDFVKLTQDFPIHIRFIEFMPFEGNAWQKEKVLTTAEMLAKIEPYFSFDKLSDEKHATAKKYQLAGACGTFAFITTMTQPFCGDCNRMRITAEGKMKNCLFGKEEIDLLSALRKENDIIPLILSSLHLKHALMGGQFDDTYIHTNPEHLQNRSMIQIGG